MTPAKPESNDVSSQIQACRVLLCLTSPPFTLLNPGWSGTVQVNNCEDVERQVGKVEEYPSHSLYCKPAFCCVAD